MANRSDTPGAAPSGMRLLRAVLALSLIHI